MDIEAGYIDISKQKEPKSSRSRLQAAAFLSSAIKLHSTKRESAVSGVFYATFSSSLIFRHSSAREISPMLWLGSAK